MRVTRRRNESYEGRPEESKIVSQGDHRSISQTNGFKIQHTSLNDNRTLRLDGNRGNSHHNETNQWHGGSNFDGEIRRITAQAN